MEATTLLRAPRALARALTIAGLATLAATFSASDATAQMEGLGMFGNMPEVANYRMTSERLAQFTQATHALKQLDDEGGIDMEAELDVDDPSELSVERIASAFDRHPRVRAAIQGAGMDTREYVTFMMSMVQTIMGSVMVQMGGEQALADMPDSALKHNIRFFLDNQAAFEALDDDS
jgi:hypothetical protein